MREGTLVYWDSPNGPDPDYQGIVGDFVSPNEVKFIGLKSQILKGNL